MTPTTEKRVKVFLDEEREMVFNANSMCKFEETTGRFFLDAVASLHEVMKPYIEARLKRDAGQLVEDDAVSALTVMRKVSVTQLSALLHASLHVYVGNPPEPRWPLTLPQVRSLMRPKDVIRIFMAFLIGQSANSPSKEEMGESPARTNPVPNGAPESTHDLGGGPSIELPPDAFA